MATIRRLQEVPRHLLVCEKSNFSHEKSRHRHIVGTHHYNYRVSLGTGAGLFRPGGPERPQQRRRAPPDGPARGMLGAVVSAPQGACRSRRRELHLPGCAAHRAAGGRPAARGGEGLCAAATGCRYPPRARPAGSAPRPPLHGLVAAPTAIEPDPRLVPPLDQCRDAHGHFPWL